MSDYLPATYREFRATYPQVAEALDHLGHATDGAGPLDDRTQRLVHLGIAIGALAVYTRVDTRRRTESIYSAPRWAATLYWAVLAVCLIGIALGAWQIALWAGRQ